MRIIGGNNKGMKLVAPKKREGYRPTEDRIKENLFNILGPVNSKSFLDAFSCTGSIGIEALSRGSSFVCFSDRDKDNIFRLKDNLSKARINSNYLILEGDFRNNFKLLGKRLLSFDIIYLDPPYKSGLYDKAAQLIHKESLMKKDGLLVVESDFQFDSLENFEIYDQRKYGSTYLSFFRWRNDGCSLPGEL